MDRGAQHRHPRPRPQSGRRADSGLPSPACSAPQGLRGLLPPPLHTNRHVQDAPQGLLRNLSTGTLPLTALQRGRNNVHQRNAETKQEPGGRAVAPRPCSSLRDRAVGAGRRGAVQRGGSEMGTGAEQLRGCREQGEGALRQALGRAAQGLPRAGRGGAEMGTGAERLRGC